MKTMILSCTTGEGHNACARAIKEYFDLIGEECVIEDSLSYVSEEFSRLLAKGHEVMYRKFAPIFEWGYEYAENHPERFDEESSLYHLFARGAEDLFHSISQGSYDTVLCTHPFSAMMLTEVIRRYGLKAYTGFVATDYTCCPGVNCSELDRYFIPDAELTGEFIAHGIPEEKIVPSGIPVRQAFFTEAPAGEAKAAFGVDPGHRHVVLACGSMGCGPMEELSQALVPVLEEDTELTILCGTNEKLEQSMETIHGDNPRVHVHSFLKNMPLLLDGTDVYITKPGGLSITEAMAKNTPMVLVKAVGGCETYNLEHLLEQGRARTGDTVEELAQACRELLETLPLLELSPQQNAAPILYETMKQRSVTHEETETPCAGG